LSCMKIRELLGDDLPEVLRLAREFAAAATINSPEEIEQELEALEQNIAEMEEWITRQTDPILKEQGRQQVLRAKERVKDLLLRLPEIEEEVEEETTE